MLSFVAQRVVKGVIVLLAIVVLNFFLIRLAPGDPAIVMAGEAGASDQVFVKQLREKFGLDKPLPEQLFIYVKGVATLDLGFSFRQQAPVAKLIGERLPATLLLTLTAFAISLTLGILFGTFAARFAGTFLDTAITVFALIFYAMPIFWVALMGILLFSVTMDWLPSFGYETVGANLTGLAHAVDVAKHLIMPAMTLGLFFMATYTRMTRASMLEVKRLDFVKTARAKGLSDAVIQRRHVLRNALLPVVTLAGVHSGTLIGGAVITETVFAWPGIGRLMYDALLQRDYNLLLGVFVICSAMVLIFNLITDLVYRLVDPAHRIRHMKQFWKSMLKSPSGVIGLVILLLAISVAVFGPMLFPNSPWRMVQRPFLPPFTLSSVPLGTDALGRDVFAGMIFGARVSLLVGLVSTLVALLVGVPIGAMAGYFGGKVDDALMRFTEFFQTIPSFALAIVLVAILQPSIYSIVASIALVSWPPVARLVRGEVLSLRTREYVQAAVVTGQSNSWIILREILPNALSPVIVLASLMVATAILLESSLAFLGLGDPNLISWGYMVGAGRTVIRQAWWITVFPGVAILISVLGLNLIGEGLNDALNPRLSREGR
ncbi:ABC-type dipeptide/oligopeptide/nickel transport system permease component [Bradyrhizobium sp. USDA 376]